ncbi:hypothetical protein GDO86_000940, partial [Hymenochirus boettgeri]
IRALHPFIENLEHKSTDHDEDIEFTDVGFSSLVQKNHNNKKSKSKVKREHKIYGNPDPKLPVSGKQCTGCGAILHSIEPSLPGYLPSEKYASFLQLGDISELMCQRCFLLIHHQKALNISVSQEEYRNIVGSIRTKKGLVLLMVDMFDIPNSIFPDLLNLVGENKKILVLGNKVDLLPGDSPGYLKYLKGQLHYYCINAGINNNGNMADVLLISAKTGYGVEDLISNLQRSWKYKGDVYLVGATNAGKSTLFNALLQSDYCQEKASGIIKEATISPWPGTTLNLLKFPIANPKPYRMFQRQKRLKEDFTKTEEDLSEEEQKHLRNLKTQSYVVGRVGRTFTTQRKLPEDIEFDADLLSVNPEDDSDNVPLAGKEREVKHFTENEIKDAHWFYDTPGIVKEFCVLNHLKDKEVKVVLPTKAILPRTFILQPGMTLFLGALGRIDFVQGEKQAWFSVIASNLLPVHITSSSKADVLYKKHAGSALLGVPSGGEDRMKEFPPLHHQDIQLEGIGTSRAVADIKLSTAGWVAVTGHAGEQLYLRCYTPQGTTMTVRQPPLLPQIVNIRGERIRKSPAYVSKKSHCLVKNLK